MTTKNQYKNELIKRDFYKFLRGPKGHTESSVVRYEAAIWLWQEFVGHKKPLHLFDNKKAERFVTWLKQRKKSSGKGTVSLRYTYDVLRYLRKFFGWMCNQREFRSKISYSDVEYLRLTDKENQQVLSKKSKKVPTLEEVKTVIENIPESTEVEMRDKALISLTLLTGIRIKALTTLSLRCFDEEKLTILQSPNLGVETKFSKTITTGLVPITYDAPMDYFVKWFRYLRDEKEFAPDEPLFPGTKRIAGKGKELGFYSNGEVEPVFWKSTSSARKIFQKRFEQVDLPYYHPHSFRDLLVQEISKIPLTEEEKKAISQNFGHANVGTTFGSYGYGGVSEERQCELVRKLTWSGRQLEPKVVLSLEEVKKLLEKNSS